MVSVLASSAVDHGFEPRSGQTKGYKCGICCFSFFRSDDFNLTTRQPWFSGFLVRSNPLSIAIVISTRSPDIS